MGRKSKIDRLSDQEVIDLYNAGNSVVDIGKMFGAAPINVSRKLRNAGVVLRRKGSSNSGRKRKYAMNDAFLSNITTQEQAYYLGFMYGDGYLTGKNTVGVALDAKDEIFLRQIKALLGAENPIHKFRSRFSTKHPYTNKIKLVLDSDQLFKDLVANGCVRAKTDDLKFPTHIQEHLIRHFIRGYFDADGSVFLPKSPKLKFGVSIGFSFVGTKDMITHIHERMTFSKAKIHKETRTTSDNVYYVSYGGVNSAKVFYNYIYAGATIWLPRKRDVFEEYFNMRNPQRLPSADPNDTDEGQGIVHSL